MLYGIVEVYLPPPALHLITSHSSYLTLLLALATPFFATSCGEDDLVVPDVPDVPDVPEPTPDPDPTPVPQAEKGWLALDLDWSDALTEASVPDTVLARFGDSDARAYATALGACSDSLPAGSYGVEAWNVPIYINVRAGEASVQTDDEGLLLPMPGYLFAASAEGIVAAEDTARVSLAMRRLVAPVVITLNFTKAYKVKSVSASLSGLVSAVSLSDGSPIGKEAVARFAWSAQEGNKGLVLRLRTLGIVRGAGQILEASIRLADGRTLSIRSDISDYLADLHALEPIHLENTIDTERPEPEPDPMPDPDYPVDDPDVESGFTAIIEGWTVVDGGDLPAEEVIPSDY